MRWAKLIAAIAAVSWPYDPDAAGTSDAAHYRSIDSFLGSIPGVVKDQVKGAYGDLAGSGRRDWAGSVAFRGDSPGSTDIRQQVFVLTQTIEGDYVVAAHSASAGLLVSDVVIRKSSVFVKTEEYQAGIGADRYFQFKLRSGQWRLIGARFHLYCRQDGEDGTVGMSLSDLDWNLVTGAAIVRQQSYEQEAKQQRLSIAIEPPLLDGITIDQGLAWPQLFERYPPC